MKKTIIRGIAIAICCILTITIFPNIAEPVSGATVLTPVASGASVHKNGKVILDASNLAKGYVMLKYIGSNPKIKVQVAKAGKETYTYTLNARNAYEVFPMSEGNGAYNVKVFENVSGSSYSLAFSKDVNVALENQFLPFLHPNQYVNYTASSNTVKVGDTVVRGAKDDVEKVQKIYKYVTGNIDYDKAKAASVKSGYLPNVDQILSIKKGICFDYAALMATMLRTQNVPTKLVVGYTGNNVYHAWINVYIAGSGWVDGAIFFDGKNWTLMDPTFASSGKNSDAIKKYIGDGSNYKQKYVY